MNPVAVATAAVEEASRLLVKSSPEALERSAELFREVYGLEEDIRKYAGPDALEQARKLRASICRASILLARAHAYHFRWRTLASLANGGYQADGAPSAGQFHPAICFRA
jgi:hypothetical protein